MELELAAVTEPSLAKAGFRWGIFSGLALPGCSSVSTSVSPRALGSRYGAWLMFSMPPAIMMLLVPALI